MKTCLVCNGDDGVWHMVTISSSGSMFEEVACAAHVTDVAETFKEAGRGWVIVPISVPA